MSRKLSVPAFGLLLMIPAFALAAPIFRAVQVAPHVRDADTLFLATFDADEAATYRLEDATRARGPMGGAIVFGTQGVLSVPPEGHLSPRAGTIEMVLRNTNPQQRHSLVRVGGERNPTRWLHAQMDAACWWSAGGARPWVRDVDIRRDFAEKWMYAVFGWDTDARVATVCIYTLDGRFFRDRIRYRDTAEMTPEQAQALAAGRIENVDFGSRGIELNTLRISGVYRKDLLDPEQDWGPVEQWTPYPPARKLFDEETRVKEWRADKDGAAPDRLVPIERVIRDRNYQPSGQTKPPVPAWRCSPGAPVFDLDFGVLDIGCYVVRVIAMVKTEDIDKYRKPLYVDLKVNDQPGGGISWYRNRVPYWDDFYAVAEMYINVDEKRAYRGALTVGEGSLADLYIHNIEFHDVLAGLPRKALKEKTGTFTYDEREQLRKNAEPQAVWNKVRQEVALQALHQPGAPELPPEERARRDELLWNAFPPLNSQFVAEYDEGFFTKDMSCGDMSVGEVNEKYGVWTMEDRYGAGWYNPLLLRNDKLNLVYTRDDLSAHRPLPDPYPFKDDGYGVYFPPTERAGHATHFLPIAVALGYRWQSVWDPLATWHGGEIIYRLPYLYHALNQRNAARDAAFLLCRWAYTYPTHTDAQTLGYALLSPATMYNRDMRLRLRALAFYWGSSRGATLQQGLAQSYDFLFDFIRGNQELAQAVGRFIPWVKTDADVRRLIETRILQFGAKQSLRFHLINSKEHSVFLLRTALIQQNPDATRPWLTSLWRNTHIYPHPNTGLPDFLSTTTQRDGTTDIGSVFYTWAGSPFLETVALTRRYVANGGDGEFDLYGPAFRDKMAAACAFPLDGSVAGGYPLTIGDVGGPAKPRLFSFLDAFESNFRLGFAWTGDPRFAWLVKNYYGRRTETDAEWRQIEEAAERQRRNPFLAQRSRVMTNWAGILESGGESDDFRFKRAVYLRTGTGHGHAHADTLDLQMLAHGVRVVNDVGHRGSYGQPSPADTVVHNLVEINGDGGRGGNWMGHAWISAFSTAAGAQFMSAEAVPPSGNFRDVRLRSRAVALIDVDEGAPGTKAPAPLPYTDRTVFDPAAVTPSSYVFDVQRVSGGKMHTFCFHGTWSDQFDVNVLNKTETLSEEEDRYMRKYLRGPGMKYVGDAPDSILATWRLRRTEGVVSAIQRDGKPVELKQQNAEQQMLGANYREEAPPKFTRLRLFGCEGERLMVGWIEPFQERVQMTWPFLMVQRRGENLESVYPSLIEPYAGEPFLMEAQVLPIPDNENDAQRAVAVEVRTRNGRTDLCFSDGRIKPRQAGDVRVTGRFAYVSRDDKGLRLLSLVEGTELATPWGTLTMRAPDRKAGIISVDYWARVIRLDAAWPTERLGGEQVEIGNDSHCTSYTIASARSENGATVLVLDKAADLSYAAVTGVIPAERKVGVKVAPTALNSPGMTHALTCTNADLSRSWKCRFLGDDPDLGKVFALDGDLAAEDFPLGSTFRLWEFGVGDTVRLAARAAVRRAENGALTVEGNPEAVWTTRATK